MEKARFYGLFPVFGFYSDLTTRWCVSSIYIIQFIFRYSKNKFCIPVLFIEASRLRWVFLHILQPALRRKRRLLSIIQLTKRPITHPYFGFIFALTVTIIFFTLYIGWHNRLIIKNFNLHTTKFIFNNKLYCIIYLFIRTL